MISTLQPRVATSARPTREQQRPLRVCLLGLGGGGFHLESRRIINSIRRSVELVLVFSGPRGGIKLWESPHPVRATYHLRSPSLKGDRFWHKLYYVLVNLVQSIQVLIVDKPDVLLAVGTAQAIPFGIAAKLLGIPMWFAESLTRVERPSRTGKWIYRGRLSTRFFYYWPDLADYYPHGTYIPVFS